MRLRQLEYFVAVAEKSSFTRAAAALGISQPVLSRQIRTLEKDLGVDLFTRTSRKVALTRSGERLLPDAYHILDRVEAARRNVIGESDAALRIGTYSTAGLNVFRRILAEYVATYDEPPIEVAVLHWDEMGPAIREGQVDAGFITAAARHRFPDHDGLILTKLETDPRVAVVRRDHVLAGSSEVSIGDLTPYDFVGTAGLSAAHCKWWNVDPRPDGSSPHIQRSATTVAELLDIVSLTGDVAITTQSAAEIRERTDIEFIHLIDVEPAATYLAWSEAASPFTRRFVDVAKQVSQRPS